MKFNKPLFAVKSSLDDIRDMDWERPQEVEKYIGLSVDMSM